MRWMTIGRVLAMVALVGVVGGTTTLAQQEGQGGSESQGGQLAVTVEYKGAGSVDKEHRLWIFVFDTPNISAESMPVATGTIAENGGTYKFVGLPKEVYLAVAFDEQGGYEMTGPPPVGSPITIHGIESGGAAAVPTGDDGATVTVTFDDSIRMQ